MSKQNYEWDGPANEIYQAVTTSFVMLALGQIGFLLHWTLWYVALFGVGLSLLTSLSALSKKPRRFRTAVARAAAGLLGTAWVGWAINRGIFHLDPTHRLDPAPLYVLVAFLVAMALACAWMDYRDHTEAELLSGLPSMGLSQDELDIAVAVPSAKGARVIGRNRWANDNGYSLRVALPADRPVSIGDFELAAKDKLPKQFQLPIGCGVEVAEGQNRAEVLLHIQTKDGHEQTKKYTLALPSPLSISDPTPLGWRRTGTGVGVGFFPLEGAQTAFLAGRKRSGKSNVLNVLIAGWGRTEDAVVWVIDPSTKHGADFRGWVDPYLAGLAESAAIDWLAIGEAEAHRMLDAALRIAGSRLRGHKTRKITPGPRTPALILVMDEAATFLAGSNPAITAKWVRLIKEGGAAGIVLVTSCLRAVGSEFADQNVKVQASIRIGMKVAQKPELDWLFDYRPVDMRSMRHIGQGFVMQDSYDPEPFKTWMLDDEEINPIAIEVGQTRAPLEGISVAAAGPDYVGRWDRIRNALAGKLEATTTASTGGSISRIGAALAELEAVPKAEIDPWSGLDPQDRAELEEMARQIGEEVGDQGGATFLADVLELIPEGKAGVLTEDVVDLLGGKYPGLDAKKIANLLRPLGVSSVDIKIEGVVRKGYRRDALQTALNKIR